MKSDKKCWDVCQTCQEMFGQTWGCEKLQLHTDVLLSTSALGLRQSARMSSSGALAKSFKSVGNFVFELKKRPQDLVLLCKKYLTYLTLTYFFVLRTWIIVNSTSRIVPMCRVVNLAKSSAIRHMCSLQLGRIGIQVHEMSWVLKLIGQLVSC